MEEIVGIGQEYLEYIDKEIKKLNPSVLLYGSTAYGKMSSDLDVALIVEDYTMEDMKTVKEKTIRFQEEHKMNLDAEVPYENKLMYRQKDIQDMLRKGPFPIENGKVSIKPVIKSEEYMASKEMKDRLLLNVLTTRSLLLRGDNEIITQYKEQAWETLIKNVASYSGLKEFDLNEFIQLLYKDKNSSADGELFLGYKTNIPQKKIDLIEDCKRAFLRLEKNKKIEKTVDGKIIPNKMWLENQEYQLDVIDQFRKEVIDIIPSDEEPKIIFLGGLPGSGKTELAKYIRQECQDKEFVIIDVDEYRSACTNVNTEEPIKAVERTSESANEIEMNLLCYALNNRKNIIHISTLRATDIITKFIEEEVIQRGYHIEANILSVPFYESALSAQERYEKQIASDEEVPRFISMEFMKHADTEIFKTMRTLENSGHLDSLKVFERGSKLGEYKKIYDSKDESKKYRNSLDAIVSNRVKLDKQIPAKTMLERARKVYKAKKIRKANVEEYKPLLEIVEHYEDEKAR